MTKVYAERNPDGSFAPITLATGQRYKIALRVLKLDYRYHDDDPIQGAPFTVRFANGYQVSGKLDEHGRARVLGVPGGQAEVRYGPDDRPYQPVEQEENPDYRPEATEADLDTLFERYQQG